MHALTRAIILTWALIPVAVTLAPAQQLVPLREAFADANGDFVPDRMGTIVRIVATVTSEARPAGKSAQLLYAQDSTRGVVLFRRDTRLLATVKPGDVIEAVGKVDQYRGMQQLRVQTLRRLASREPLKPREATIAEVRTEEAAGSLFRISGTLVVEKTSSGLSAWLRDTTGQIRIFLSPTTAQNAHFLRRMEEGGRVIVVGNASKYAAEAPYNTGYEFIPRSSDDWRFARPLPYGTIAWLSGFLILLSLATYLYLQRRRAEKHSEQLRALTHELEHRNHELRQAQKMEAVGRLAGGVAHDFNNVLTVIIGHTDFLIDELGPEYKLIDDLEEIRRSAEHAATLTRQLLAFSRKQVLQAEVLDVNTVIFNTNRMLNRLLGEDIVLTTSTEAKVPKIYADPVQLQQIILNLAVNARDAMPDGGTLTIATAPFTVTQGMRIQGVEIDPGEYALMTVRDVGCGMDEAIRAAAFEPFFTTKEPGKGTGLGLSTVYGIVKQSGGYVFIDSVPGAGSTFSIYLPATSKAYEDEYVVAPSPVKRIGHETVLLVEDESAVRTLIARVLERDGYTILSAACGAEALALAQRSETQIDLLLTDLVMPGMNGRELFQRLACRRPELRVLFCSGYTPDDVVQHQILERDWPFLGKPFSANEIREKVAEVLESEPASADLLLESWQTARA